MNIQSATPCQWSDMFKGVKIMNNLGSYLQAPGYIQSQNVDYLSSPNGLYFALVQEDGNFCVYPGEQPPASDTAVWCAMCQQGQGVYYAAMQQDGNLCVYVGTVNNPIGAATWCAMSNGSASSYFLELDDYGSLSVWTGSPDFPGNKVWSSGQ